MFHTSLSETLDSTGRIDIGLKCFSAVGKSALGIGLIFAGLHAFVKYDFLIQLLIIAVKGPTTVSVTSLTNLMGIMSGPVEQSDLKEFKVCRTSERETSLRLNIVPSVSESAETATVFTSP